MAEETEDTFDKLKAGAKAVAKKVTGPNRDLGTEYEKEKIKEGAGDYEQADTSGAKDPMSPEKIASHEPTAVKRDPSDQEIVEGGDTGADSPEAQEKLRKKGMTKV